jgi:hypothetical protein
MSAPLRQGDCFRLGISSQVAPADLSGMPAMLTHNANEKALGNYALLCEVIMPLAIARAYFLQPTTAASNRLGPSSLRPPYRCRAAASRRTSLTLGQPLRLKTRSLPEPLNTPLKPFRPVPNNYRPQRDPNTPAALPIAPAPTKHGNQQERKHEQEPQRRHAREPLRLLLLPSYKLVMRNPCSASGG